MERVFVILKVRWRALLTKLVAHRENALNLISTCFVLHNFYEINGDTYLENSILYETRR